MSMFTRAAMAGLITAAMVASPVAMAQTTESGAQSRNSPPTQNSTNENDKPASMGGTGVSTSSDRTAPSQSPGSEGAGTDQNSSAGSAAMKRDGDAAPTRTDN